MRGRRFFMGGELELIGKEGMLNIGVEEIEEEASSKGSAGVPPAVSYILRDTSSCGWSARSMF